MCSSILADNIFWVIVMMADKTQNALKMGLPCYRPEAFPPLEDKHESSANQYRGRLLFG